MRHIASIVKDGQVSYALVDEDSGTITQFAQILVPEHWDLHSSAVLGHNLVEVIGLNGRKVRSPKRQPPAVGQQSLLELDAAHDEPQVTHYEPEPKAKQRTGRGRGAPGHKRAKPDPANKVGYYIGLERVVSIINEYPEGIMARQIAERIWRLDGNDGETPRWVTRSVENRLAQAQASARSGSAPLPFGIEYRPVIGVDGEVTKKQAKYLVPAEQAEP